MLGQTPPADQRVRRSAMDIGARAAVEGEALFTTPPCSRHGAGGAGARRPGAARAKHWTSYARGGIPEYLAKHYWWAYLSRFGVRFFDRELVISAILFGNYRRLVKRTLGLLKRGKIGRTLQLTCVYGSLTPHLAEQVPPQDLHVVDVAPIQLEATRRKLTRQASGSREIARMVRMNAEALAYADDSFDTIVIFFLFHELPAEVRERALTEALRVLRPGGRLLITEYGQYTRTHPFHRLRPLRWIFGNLEPFLPGFWKEDLTARVGARSWIYAKRLTSTLEDLFFGGFYRVTQYRIAPADALGTSRHATGPGA